MAPCVPVLLQGMRLLSGAAALYGRLFAPRVFMDAREPPCEAINYQIVSVLI